MDLLETIEKLHAFRKLEDGWRFGFGGAPDEALILKAEKTLRNAFTLGIGSADVFTGNNREVVVALYKTARDLEIIFEADGSITVAEDIDDKQIDFVENLTDTALFKRIWQFQFPQGNSYAPSIRETLQPTKARSRALHFNLPVITAESQSSTVNAPSKQVEVYANTLSDSIPTKLPVLVSTGLFLRCPVDA